MKKNILVILGLGFILVIGVQLNDIYKRMLVNEVKAEESEKTARLLTDGQTKEQIFDQNPKSTLGEMQQARIIAIDAYKSYEEAAKYGVNTVADRTRVDRKIRECQLKIEAQKIIERYDKAEAAVSHLADELSGKKK